MILAAGMTQTQVETHFMSLEWLLQGNLRQMIVPKLAGKVTRRYAKTGISTWFISRIDLLTSHKQHNKPKEEIATEHLHKQFVIDYVKLV